jgi:hypothetical protein
MKNLYYRVAAATLLVSGLAFFPLAFAKGGGGGGRGVSNEGTSKTTGTNAAPKDPSAPKSATNPLRKPSHPPKLTKTGPPGSGGSGLNKPKP